MEDALIYYKSENEVYYLTISLNNGLLVYDSNFD